MMFMLEARPPESHVYFSCADLRHVRLDIEVMSLPASPSNYRRTNSLQHKDKPKDFILISEFSELVGPLAVVSVVR